MSMCTSSKRDDSSQKLPTIVHVCRDFRILALDMPQASARAKKKKSNIVIKKNKYNRKKARSRRYRLEAFILKKKLIQLFIDTDTFLATEIN